MKILVVDDHYAIARLLKRFFEREGHAVTLYANAETCLSEFKRGVYSAAFLDIDLGKRQRMNGLDLAEKLRGVDPTIKINMMSGDWTYGDEVERRGLGELLRKPFDLADLLGRLRNEE